MGSLSIAESIHKRFQFLDHCMGFIRFKRANMVMIVNRYSVNSQSAIGKIFAGDIIFDFMQQFFRCQAEGRLQGYIVFLIVIQQIDIPAKFFHCVMSGVKEVVHQRPRL